MTTDGKQYAPERFDDLVKERYVICSRCHIPYSDTGKMTPKERELLFKYIVEDAEAKKKLIEERSI